MSSSQRVIFIGFAFSMFAYLFLLNNVQHECSELQFVISCCEVTHPVSLKDPFTIILDCVSIILIAILSCSIPCAWLNYFEKYRANKHATKRNPLNCRWHDMFCRYFLTYCVWPKKFFFGITRGYHMCRTGIYETDDDVKQSVSRYNATQWRHINFKNGPFCIITNCFHWW